jgi:hypothetical protein
MLLSYLKSLKTLRLKPQMQVQEMNLKNQEVSFTYINMAHSGPFDESWRTTVAELI